MESNVIELPIKPKNQKVFIYGTLKKGQYFHDQYLGGEKSTYLGQALISSDYSLYVDTLPSLVREKCELGMVKGELYEVDSDVLKSLDDLEGHPRIYRREVVDIEVNGEKTTAWAYVRSNYFKGKNFASKELEFV